MIGRIWETNKWFIIGIAVSVLFLFVGHRFLVARLHNAAESSFEDAKKKKESLDKMFSPSAPEQPTDQTLKRYRAQSASLKSELDQVRNQTGFPIQSPFLVPQGEQNPDIYYSEVKSKIMREIKSAADARAITLGPSVLSGEGAVDSAKVSEALVALAVARRSVLTAIASGVTAVESILYGSGERSAPVFDYKLVEKLITVTVRGTPEAIQEWLRNLMRRESFLIVVAATVKGPDERDSAGDDTVQCKAVLGPLVIEDYKETPAEED